MTCSNCSRDALYSYPVSPTYIIHYCQSHLPNFLVAKRNAGQLPLIDTTPKVEEPVVVKASKKAAVVVEPEVVAEEPIAEEAVEDAEGE
jgi:hypothetical protein